MVSLSSTTKIDFRAEGFATAAASGAAAGVASDGEEGVVAGCHRSGSLRIGICVLMLERVYVFDMVSPIRGKRRGKERSPAPCTLYLFGGFGGDLLQRGDILLRPLMRAGVHDEETAEYLVVAGQDGNSQVSVYPRIGSRPSLFERGRILARGRNHKRLPGCGDLFTQKFFNGRFLGKG